MTDLAIVNYFSRHMSFLLEYDLIEFFFASLFFKLSCVSRTINWPSDSLANHWGDRKCNTAVLKGFWVIGKFAEVSFCDFFEFLFWRLVEFYEFHMEVSVERLVRLILKFIDYEIYYKTTHFKVFD